MRFIDFNKFNRQIYRHNHSSNVLHRDLQLKVKISRRQQFNLKLKHTRHSRRRASQRSIPDGVLLMVLMLGTAIRVQNSIYITVTEKDLPRELDHSLAEKMRNLIVILSSDSQTLITCYYAKNGVKHLKKRKRCTS